MKKNIRIALNTLFVFVFISTAISFAAGNTVVPSTCGVCDLHKDGFIDYKDFVVFASCWMSSDITPPNPTQSQWADNGKPSLVVGTSDIVRMTAKTAIDDWSDTGVQYYFTWYPENDTALLQGSGWLESPSFFISGLLKDTKYYFVVKARDAYGNQTADSTPAVVIISDIDVYPPYVQGINGTNINRASWGFYLAIDLFDGDEHITYTGMPYSTAIFRDPYPTIEMAAQPGIDPEGSQVYYRFDRLDPVTGIILTSSGWQESLTWTDGHDDNDRLVADQEYIYSVTMRDSAGNQSFYSYSQTVIAELFPDDMDIEAPPVPVWGVPVIRYECKQINIDLLECFNLGCWDFLEVMPVIDPQGYDVEYYFEETATGNNSGWISDCYWQSQIDGLYESHSYRVKCRDTSQAKNESGWSVIVSKEY